MISNYVNPLRGYYFVTFFAPCSCGATGEIAIETSVAPTWDDIGRLAAIAVVRTFLNYFLERDLNETREKDRESVGG